MINMPQILVVGLTGMSGSGKTTVCDIFKENGFDIINADNIAREVMKKDSKCLNETVQQFSKDILYDNGELNRKKLADIIFSSSDKKSLYQDVIYPYISYEIIEKIYNFHANGSKAIVLDAPTLFESGADDLCSVTLSVVSDLDKCGMRILIRDNLTLEQAEKRLRAQYDKDFYKEKTDFNIENNGNIDELKDNIEKIIKDIWRFYGEKKSKQDKNI